MGKGVYIVYQCGYDGQMSKYKFVGEWVGGDVGIG